MPLVYFDEDPWVREHEACEALCNEVAARLDQWRSAGAGGAGGAAEVRLRLRQCDQQLSQLRSSLHADDGDSITSEERERRERQLEALEARARRLRADAAAPFTPRAPPPDPNRRVLFDDDDDDLVIAGRSAATGNSSSKDYQPMDPETARQRQSQMIEDQDKGLEALSKIISRQKNIAENIGNEVTSQNQIVSDIADIVDTTGNRTQAATRRTTDLMVRDSTWGYWTVIIILFVAIIVVAII